MKVESMVAVRADRHGEMLAGRLRALAAAATLALAPAAAHAAAPVGAAPASQSPGVRFEQIPGSSLRRVILVARAAERLGIQTTPVREESVVRKQMVGGLIIPPMDKQPEPKPVSSEFGGFGRPPAAPPPQAGAPAPPVAGAGALSAPAKAGGGGFDGHAVAPTVPARQASAAEVPLPAAGAAQTPAAGEVWVLVTLSPGEWDKLAKDKPARLQRLATREQLEKDVLAQPTGMPPLEDAKRSMLSVYYAIPGLDHGLAVNNRVRVELQLAGSDEKQKVVPYAAVYYDAKGTAWVYVNPKPLTFERRRVAVDRVVGDVAVLSEGPPAGTPVVTVGAALLYGAEIYKK
jgi:hypothetical protein